MLDELELWFNEKTWLDWAYQTVPQTSANGQSQTIRAGRALGGSTSINGLAWSKPHDFQVSCRIYSCVT